MKYISLVAIAALTAMILSIGSVAFGSPIHEYNATLVRQDAYVTSKPMKGTLALSSGVLVFMDQGKQLSFEFLNGTKPMEMFKNGTREVALRGKIVDGLLQVVSIEAL
jgi:hypothetical protein